ncbi:MAG: protein-export chaperone SecB [Proteobacteria bacterium]|nr:protein-export chaperone SecB [Pseudomonadota bacterium]
MTEQTLGNENQPVAILGQFVKDLSFENPDPIAFLAIQDAQPEINMDVNINANGLNDGHFEVVLKVKLTAKHQEKTIFLSELAYSTIAKIDEEAIGKENMGPILMVHIPHLAFPFVRAILYNVIRDGGLPPFAIHPIDFAGMYEQNAKNQENPTIN